MSVKGGLVIRPAGLGDLDGLMRIFASARSFMRRSGNMHQWEGGYPPEALMRSEIVPDTALYAIRRTERRSGHPASP